MAMSETQSPQSEQILLVELTLLFICISPHFISSSYGYLRQQMALSLEISDCFWLSEGARAGVVLVLGLSESGRLILMKDRYLFR